MPTFKISFADALNRGIKTITRKTNLRQTVAGSKIRSSLETTSQEFQNLSNLEEVVQKRVFLQTATGQFLDQFGAMVGLSKYPQRNAEALAEDRVFRFTTRLGGTFGSINGGNGFTIPSGTILTAPASVSLDSSVFFSDIDQPDNRYDRSIHFSVTADVYCASTATEVYASARSLTPGVIGNLAAPGMIREHTFTEYNDYLSKSLIVTNAKPLLNGFDVETEASYKYRISKEITASQKANDTSVRVAALSVPGVSDVVLVPWEDGAGRFNVYVKSISSVVSDQMIEDVQVAIDEVVAAGNLGFARKPYEIGIEISTNLVYKKTYDTDVRNEVIDNLTTAASLYINSLSLGQPLVLQELASQLTQVDGRVSSVGTSRKTLFDAVFVFYPAKLADGGRRREKLIVETVVVPPHGRIVVEPNISNPIRFV